jgi:hypothetical protein
LLKHKNGNKHSTIHLILKMTILRAGDDFNREGINPGFRDYWCQDDDDKPMLVKADFFRETHDNAKNLENKVVLGFVIRLNAPAKRATVRGQVSKVAVESNNKKRSVIQSTTIPYQFMMVCLDPLNLPHTFTVLFNRKVDYQHIFGPAALSEQVSLGDCLAFFEASASTDTIGDNVTILRTPTVCAKISPPPKLPNNNALRCTDRAWVGWYNRGRHISLSQVKPIIGGNGVPCTGVACDRQIVTCKGCFGKSTCLHPIVLEYTVQLLGEQNYNPTANAIFPKTRSYRFSSLFFRNIDAVAALPSDTIECSFRTFRKKIDTMVACINRNGGWTCVGWHRQGQVHDQDSDEMLESSTTDGHIVRLEPSSPDILKNNEFLDLLIETPSVSFL